VARSIAVRQIELGQLIAVALLVVVPRRSAPNWQKGRIFFSCAIRVFEGERSIFARLSQDASRKL
jgi:hypothetical protein